MFSNEFARYVDAFTDVLDEVVTSGEAVDAQARAGVTHVLNVVVPTLAPASGSTVYATKDEVIAGAGGGIPEAMADARYAPITGSLVYATKAEIPDVSAKANTVDVVAALATKSDTTHTHAGVYQPAGAYLVAADISTKANTADVTTALGLKADQATTYTKSEVDTALSGKQAAGSYLVAADIAGKANATDVVALTALVASTSGASDSDNHVYTTKAANATFSPAGCVNAAYMGNYVANYSYNKTEMDSALSAKSDTSHTHGTLPSAILTTASPSGASDTNVYSALESDARYASVAGAGITQTQADVRYLQITDAASTYQTQIDTTTALAGKSNTDHTHAGVYQPVGSYVDVSVNNLTNYYTKTSSDERYATMQNLLDSVGERVATADLPGLVAGYSDPVYQTKDNMTKVGTETTYYSGAKVDALIASLGSGSTPVTYLHLTSPNKATYNPPTLANATADMAWMAWQVRTNTTPLTMAIGPNPTGGTQSPSVDTVTNGVYSCIHNRTANTYRVYANWRIGSTVLLDVASGTNDIHTWMVHMSNVPNDAYLKLRAQACNHTYPANAIYFQFDSTTTHAGNGQSNWPASKVRSRGIVRTKHLAPEHVASVMFLLEPNDLLLWRYFSVPGRNASGPLFYDNTPMAWGIEDGWVNECYLHVQQV